MANEVTKLITVSLGKIHQSRGDKHGVNLRRSLLVASVLHKARDQYVAEIKSRRTESDCTSETPEPAKRRRFSSQKSQVDTPATTVPIDNESAASDELTPKTISDAVLDELQAESESEAAAQNITPSSRPSDKENSPPSDESSRCRCLKRRLSQDTDPHTKSEPIDTHREIATPRKRTRAPEDSTQINSLAQKLSSSFAELSEGGDSSNVPFNSFSVVRREAVSLRA